MTAGGSELVEICTSGGVDYVRIDHFNTDQNLADEECPICGECPVCWMANPAKALANDHVTIRLGHIVSRDHYFAHAYLTTGPRNWTWPETRAPPKLKQI
jgi:dissimilatory sulfite reductase (desulfoviridin) alpha/beta subunit